jgi:biopolymer transport protein ExbB
MLNLHKSIVHALCAIATMGQLALPTVVLAQNSAAPAPAAASAPAVVAPAPAAAAVAPTNMDAHGENPYGLKALWSQGDIVAKTTLLILVLMSISSWYVIVTKYLEQSKITKFGRAVNADFWSKGNVNAAAQTLSEQSPYRFIADKAVEGASKHEGLLGNVDFNTWVTMSIQRAVGNVQSRLQDGLALLATVGSTGPFVGLFGTVWGIYNALVKIGMSGQASIDKVAGPVGESLIMTAIGLAVAVPAVLGYNWLVRRNKVVMEDLNAFGADLHAVLLGSVKK